MWQRSLQDAWHHGKRAIGNAFNHAVKWAGQIDHAMGFGKRVFGALQPAIQDLGGSDFNRAVMQGLHGYENARYDAIGLHNNVQSQLSRLRHAAPEIGL